MAKSSESFENDDTTGATAGIVNRSDVRATKWLGGSGGLHANRHKPGYRNFLRENVNLRKITGLPGAEEVEKEIELAQRAQIDNWDEAGMRDEMDELILPSEKEMERDIAEIEKDLKKEEGAFVKDADLNEEDEELIRAQNRREVRTH